MPLLFPAYSAPMSLCRYSVHLYYNCLFLQVSEEELPPFFRPDWMDMDSEGFVRQDRLDHQVRKAFRPAVSEFRRLLCVRYI